VSEVRLVAEGDEAGESVLERTPPAFDARPRGEREGAGACEGLQRRVVLVFDRFVDTQRAATAIHDVVPVRVGVPLNATDQVVDGCHVHELESAVLLVMVKASARAAEWWAALAYAGKDEGTRRNEVESRVCRELELDEVLELPEVRAPDELRPPTMWTRLFVHHQIVLNGNWAWAVGWTRATYPNKARIARVLGVILGARRRRPDSVTAGLDLKASVRGNHRVLD
jgi:hypothetical protein